VDGTYELFRHFYAVPPAKNRAGEEVAAVRGVLGSLIGMLESGVTHIGVATDHVIESFRNEMWAGYKTGEGVPPELMAQFWPFEEALDSMGVAVWPMVELEADDALAGAALSLGRLKKVGRVVICTPDKDLAQCVRGKRIVQLNRRTREFRDEEGVREQFGVSPASIPDYLALVGDAADGYPGLDGWGEKSAGSVVGKYDHLEKIPKSSQDWAVSVRSAEKLSATLQSNFKLALLFRDLATLRTTNPKLKSPEEIRWKGPKPSFHGTCERLEAPDLEERVRQLSSK